MKRYIILFFCILNQLHATTYTVTNTNDTGVGSFRQALLDAQTDPIPPSLINFNITGGYPQIITPQTTLPTIQTTTEIDGTSQQPGWVPGDDMPIVIDCTQLQTAAPTGFCLLIDSASNCLIKGLAIKSYVGDTVNGNAIRIRSTTAIADSNQINNCYFGCNADGSVTGPGFTDNTRSIVIRGNTAFGVTNTIIGGPNTGDGNLIVDNSVNGITLEFNVQNTLIQNNKFGTDITGMTAVGENPYDLAIFGYDDVNLDVPCNNTIIRANVFANNADSTAAAINLTQNVNYTIIDNNKIGTNSAGTAALDNVGMGINTFGSSGLPVFGTQITNNIISGNPQGGIVLNDFTNSSTISGNIIGLDITQTVTIPNMAGIVIQADTGGPGNPCTDNIIGTPGAGNVISGNTINGIYLNTDVLNTIIQGNFIGTNTMQTAFGNGGTGIWIQGSSGAPCTGSLIGGTVVSEKNIIANNGFLGTAPLAGELFGDSPTLVPANSVMMTKAGTAYGVGMGCSHITPDILNAVIGNSIYSNNGNGINLTFNANHNQQGPVLTSAASCSNEQQIFIGGDAPASPDASLFRLEFFTNPTDTDPITEGKQLVGVIPSIASGASFLLPFTSSSPITPGSFLTATATNLNNGGQPGDTSEFTDNFAINSLPALSATLSSNVSSLSPGGSAILTIDISGSEPFSVLWSDGFMQTDVVSTTMHTVSPIITTTYFATVTDVNGCNVVTSNDIVIMVNSSPTPGPVSAISAAIIAKYCSPI